jgi:hypothetical protein
LFLAAASAACVVAPPVAAHVEKSAVPMQAPIQAASSYAQREQASKDAQEFQGGATVVIFSGAALVALILLLLLI